jgi:hypothetical protein
VNARLFWKSLVVQAVAVGIPFALLAAAFERQVFEDWGWAIGPAAWFAASAVTGRVLAIPMGYVLFSALAGGVAGMLVMLATSHLPGMAAALLVFAASCGSYDPDAEAEAQREWEAERAAKRTAAK